MVDFVVVGGGVYGSAVAWELAGRGNSVRLLEAGSVRRPGVWRARKKGVRATGGPHGAALMELAYNIWPHLHEQLDAPQFYERVGQLLLLETPEQLASAEATRRMQVGLGIKTELLDQDQVRSMEPELSTKY